MDIRLIQKIRAATSNEVLDFSLLSEVLKDYMAPRDVISNLLKQKVLIRIKKGIYAFAEPYRQRSLILEQISNLIYGPSYVSREYALYYYGLIPEAVSELTCVSVKRKKIFNTPIGRFSYIPIKKAAYSIGIKWLESINKQGYFIASPEKALADMIVCKDENASNSEELLQILLKDYRIEDNSLISLDTNNLVIISRQYNKPIVKLLLETISELKYARRS